MPHLTSYLSIRNEKVHVLGKCPWIWIAVIWEDIVMFMSCGICLVVCSNTYTQINTQCMLMREDEHSILNNISNSIIYLWRQMTILFHFFFLCRFPLPCPVSHILLRFHAIESGSKGILSIDQPYVGYITCHYYWKISLSSVWLCSVIRSTRQYPQF